MNARIYIKYYSPRTRTLNYNSASTFDLAFAYHVDERPAQRASHRLVIIADDLAHIVNAQNRVVIELRACTYDDASRRFMFRNEPQIERDL
jgi:hypothetical protein